jgi:hypothetical protein
MNRQQQPKPLKSGQLQPKAAYDHPITQKAALCALSLTRDMKNP